MATDTTAGDTCSNNHSTDEEESNASMTRSTDLTKVNIIARTGCLLFFTFHIE